MAQIFHRSTNTIARVSIYGSLFVLLIVSFAAPASPAAHICAAPPTR